MRGLNKPPAPKRVAMAPAWQPAQRQNRQIRQVGQALVNVNPNVNLTAPINAPINIDLGNLPLSVGLFVGSAVGFVAKGELPPGAWRTGATICSVGLAVVGVLNLFRKKAAPAPAAAAPAPARPPPPVATVDARGNQVTSQVVNVPTRAGFNAVSGRIVNPTDFSTVDLWSWQGSYPVKIQFQNGSNEAVDFMLELTGQESPAPFGDEATAAFTQQVTLGPGETKNVDVSMPTVTWGFSKTYVDVILTAKKRRSAGDEPVMLDYKSFVIS